MNGGGAMAVVDVVKRMLGQRAGGAVALAGDGGEVDGVAKRKSAALPALLQPYSGVQRTLPKVTPASLRRFAETPVARRAINVIKDRIACLDWQVRLKRTVEPGSVAGLDAKLAALRLALEEPNASDSFRSLLEQVLEDTLVGGFGAIEMELTGDPERPFSLWPVDGATMGRVTSVAADGGLVLAAALPAGLPAAGMKVQQLVGFVDREGGSFFQEWSALFLYEGSQGDRLFLYYPRLQPCAQSAEGETTIAPSTAFVQPLTKFRALPIADDNDGQQVVCYRTYVPSHVTYI